MAPFFASAQKWTQMMNDTNANFYDIVKEFESYWKDRTVERGKGYKAFKRWQWFMEPRVYPSGNMKYASRAYALQEHNKFYKANPGKLGTAAINATVANWIPLGPFGSPTGGDAGRVQVIKVSPTNTNNFYVGTAAGGFWMTTNGGASYTTTTDQLGSCGVSDIVLDPLNSNVIYIATGDKDAGDTHSIGIMKSQNGGQTWATTGLSWTPSQQRRIYRLLINPQNPNTLIAATSVGMYRSLNAGATWTQVLAGTFVDAEYKPGDTTTVFAVTNTGFARSLNGGASYSFITIASTLSSNRLSLAVTPANNNYVYILVSNNNNAFGGLYRSVNAGTTFSLMSSTPNIFDWSTNGSGTGGQGWYDIAMDASPTNANEIIAGGVNTWKSTNGGSTWALNTHWTGSGGRPYVHADLHYVLYVNGTTVFLGTDGGVARTTNSGTSYTTINGNMNIAQIYKLGLSANTSSRIITGHQDNGTNLMNGSAWNETVGGDGMDCFIDWNNNNIMVSSYVNGAFRRTTNGGNNWNSLTNGLPASSNAAWVAPIVQDPVNPSTYYCGYNNVYKIANATSSTAWVQLGSIGTVLDEIRVAPLNPSIIYATAVGGIWKTTNGGSTWSSVSGTLPLGSAQITDLAVDNQNPNNIYVTLSGYSSGNKVYASSNGGVSWTNYSTGIPNLPVNCIVFKKNSAQALYIGTDVGVYYREASMSQWLFYSNGLPNIVVDELEIFYPTGKLRAATYARGVWETDLYSDPASPPFASFMINNSPGCVTIPLQFSDLSSNTPTAWIWSFPGGSPATSTVQNPVVTYAANGTYTVSLTASNANGSSAAFISTISVVSSPTFAPVSASICTGQSANFVVTTNGQSVDWSNGMQGLSISIPSPSLSAYNFTVTLGACSSTGTASLTINSIPPTPTIISSSPVLSTTLTGVTYQWYLNGSPIPGATLSAISPTVDGFYSLWVFIGNCSSSSQSVFFSPEGIHEYNASGSGISFRPNPVGDEMTIAFTRAGDQLYDVAIVNSIGQVIMLEKGRKMNDKNEIKLNTSGLKNGVYYVNISGVEKRVTLKFVRQ